MREIIIDEIFEQIADLFNTQEQIGVREIDEQNHIFIDFDSPKHLNDDLLFEKKLLQVFDYVHLSIIVHILHYRKL